MKSDAAPAAQDLQAQRRCAGGLALGHYLPAFFSPAFLKIVTFVPVTSLASYLLPCYSADTSILVAALGNYLVALYGFLLFLCGSMGSFVCSFVAAAPSVVFDALLQSATLVLSSSYLLLFACYYLLLLVCYFLLLFACSIIAGEYRLCRPWITALFSRGATVLFLFRPRCALFMIRKLVVAAIWTTLGLACAAFRALIGACATTVANILLPQRGAWFCLRMMLGNHQQSWTINAWTESLLQHLQESCCSRQPPQTGCYHL